MASCCNCSAFFRGSDKLCGMGKDSSDMNVAESCPYFDNLGGHALDSGDSYWNRYGNIGRTYRQEELLKELLPAEIIPVITDFLRDYSDDIHVGHAKHWVERKGRKRRVIRIELIMLAYRYNAEELLYKLCKRLSYTYKGKIARTCIPCFDRGNTYNWFRLSIFISSSKEEIRDIKQRKRQDNLRLNASKKRQKEIKGSSVFDYPSLGPFLHNFRDESF